MKRFILYVLLLFPFFCVSQEYLLPLGCNLNYYYKDLKHDNAKSLSPISQAKPSAASLELPFIEDFYYCTVTGYPDQNKWADSMVYVNHGYGIAPPSIGVATFDGLNKYGYPYNPTLANIASCLPADMLTSRPINLYTKGTQTLDPSTANVGFSFFYQARGNGDNPEVTDSLILDFYKPSQNTWNMVWHSRGNTNANSIDSVFKFVFVKITDTAYFKKDFKFRFRNWGSTAGNFDNWNIDYIILDKDRGDTLKDTVNYDIAFGQIPTPFLRNYSAMPLTQYNSGEMASNISVRLRNNYNSNFNIRYKYQITDPSGSNTYPEYDGGFGLITPFDTTGYQTYTKHSAPTTTLSGPLIMPSLDSVDFAIRHYVYAGAPTGTSVVTDLIPQNDTLLQFQRFRNYYAVDDGSCESGYYVLGVKAKMAMKINVNTPDSIRGLRIFFDPVGYINTISTSYKFRITIWSDQNGLPGSEFYKDSTYYTPKFIDAEHAPFIEYGIKDGSREAKFIPPGTYYVGYEQFNATGTITVGFDKNYVRTNSLFYNVGNGWVNSVIKGSIMMRPVFGKKVPKPVGVSEIATQKEFSFKVFPNPCNNNLTIRAVDTDIHRDNNASFRMYNTTGQLVSEGPLPDSEQSINTAVFSPGMYFLQLNAGGRMVQQQKIIISH